MRLTRPGASARVLGSVPTSSEKCAARARRGASRRSAASVKGDLHGLQLPRLVLGEAVVGEHPGRELRPGEEPVQRGLDELGIPVVAIVDTNNAPDGADYVIPGNDDAIRAIELYSAGIADAVLTGVDSLPQLANSTDEFVELDESGSPRVKAQKAAPKRAVAKKAPAKAGPAKADAAEEAAEGEAETEAKAETETEAAAAAPKKKAAVKKKAPVRKKAAAKSE